MKKELIIDESLILKLAHLMRLDLEKEEVISLTSDLKNIITYFEELDSVSVVNTKEEISGSSEFNVFRDDSFPSNFSNISPKITNLFPKSKEGYLKVPKVF